MLAPGFMNSVYNIIVCCNCFSYSRVFLTRCAGFTGGGDCGSLQPSSINRVYRTRTTTTFILHKINYIDFLSTTYKFRIM